MYFIVTPAKNEEKSLPSTIRSIEEQTVKPVVWVIVDDGSTDNTPKIIEDVKKKHDWILSIRLKEGKRDLKIHYASVCKTGFGIAISYCNENKIEYEYVALVEADMILKKAYFENLINEFEQDPKLGIASGSVWFCINGKETQLELREDLAFGANRLWRKKCFEETGGYMLTHAADSVSNVKAKLSGWKVKQFEEYKCIQTRMTSSAEGLWKGWRIRGEGSYYFNTPPFFVILRAIRYLFKKPYYVGLSYFIGYFGSYIKRKEKTDDAEIQHYYRHTRPKEMRKIYWDKLRDLFKLKSRRSR